MASYSSPMVARPADMIPNSVVRPAGPESIHAKPPLRRLIGQLPPFNDWQGCLIDDNGRFMYIFGGCEPGKEAPSSHFYRLDLQDEPMSWVDLTLKTRRVGHFSPPEPIPARIGAGVAFYRRTNRSYMLIYGGWDANGNASADLITVDLTNELDPTWDLQQSASGGTPRVEPALVVLSDRLYIFGGHQDAQDPLRAENERSQKSFCVLEFSTARLRWEWVHRDAEAPLVGHALGAVPWRGGILVVEGRTNAAADDIVLDNGAFFNYDPRWDRWSVLSVAGDLPPPAAWYNLRSCSATSQGANLCVWYETEKDDESGHALLACDIWAYDMRPVTDKLTCLKLATPIWRHKSADFEVFQLLPNGRLLLFGERKLGKQQWDVYLDLTDAAASQTNA